jgi:hypothetical protein
MEPAQYTPDAICRSMGLSAFVETGWSPPTLRLPLKPSFDPEVCLTLAGPAEAGQLSVAALAEELWRQPAPCILPTGREQAVVPLSAFSQSLAGFAAALAADRQPDGRMVCLDGMPVVGCLLANAGVEQFACNPYRPAVSAFVALLIRAAWEACRGTGVRNALAACGRYVRLDFPSQPLPPAPELCRLAVLGTPKSRSDYFQHLRPHGGK